MLEKENKINDIKTDSVISSYILLKDLFAKYYDVSCEDFTFELFNRFLEQYSFCAKEIIFSPVLRLFAAGKAKKEGYNSSVHDIQNNGCYKDLAYSEANDLLYMHFGILHEEHTFQENNNTQNPKDNYKTYIFFLKNQIIDKYPFGEQPRIALFHKNNHYELQPHEIASQHNITYEQDVDNLPKYLETAYKGIIKSTSIQETQDVLKNLQQAMRLKFKSFIKSLSPVINNPIKGMDMIDFIEENQNNNVVNIDHKFEIEKIDLELEETNPTEKRSLLNPKESEQNKIIITLLKSCKAYKQHLKNKGYQDKLTALKEIKGTLSGNKSTEQKIKDFKISLKEQARIIEPHKDPLGIQFLSAIRHIFTLGIYSKLTKGTFAFWQSHGKAFKQGTEQHCQNFEKKNKNI